MNTESKTTDVRALSVEELDLVQGAGPKEAAGFLAVMLSAMYGGPVGLAAASTYTWGPK
jgi:hypothetical protein